METRKLVFTLGTSVLAVVVATMGLVGSASAVQRVCPDGTPPPCGGGGGGGDIETPDYGDLILLYRDADGVPYLTADSCVQPLPSDTCPETCALVPGVPAGTNVVPTDPATCALTPECATCGQEVEFGRMNAARSPDSVLANQLEDVVVNLATSDCVTLDPAGRLVAITAGDLLEDSLLSTIDSPLQNLAIYKQLMMTGSLGVPLPRGATALDTAARGLGVASDKTGEVNVDLVAYLNDIMGLTDSATTTVLPKICIDVKEEVMGEVQLVEKCFLDYGSAPYAYGRQANFGALPSPAHIPGNAPQDGWFEYLALVPDTDPPLFQIVQGPIMDAVFAGEPGFTDGNIGGFAQAADDTRAVVSFMHTWQVPVDFETPVACEASGDTTYDVSISDVSGLQVPRIIVDGTEGREFTVTVANAGPDPATGTVVVTATAANGGIIEGSPWTYEFTDLDAGASQAFVQFFSVNLGQRTTIAWTATVSAPDDVNAVNNTVTATSSVKRTGGGGGG